MRRPSARPGPRKLRIEVRLALSYEALKINGRLSDRVTPLMTSAMKSACFSLSITHGPAMRKRLPEPMLMPSIWKETVMREKQNQTTEGTELHRGRSTEEKPTEPLCCLLCVTLCPLWLSLYRP